MHTPNALKTTNFHEGPRELVPSDLNKAHFYFLNYLHISQLTRGWGFIPAMIRSYHFDYTGINKFSRDKSLPPIICIDLSLMGLRSVSTSFYAEWLHYFFIKCSETSFSSTSSKSGSSLNDATTECKHAWYGSNPC